MAARTNVVLKEGLNAIHYGTFGSYFSLKYFLPMYDPTIDDDTHNGTQENTDGAGVNVRPLSAALETSADTYSTLKGEKLFRTNDTVAYTQDVWIGTDDKPFFISTDRNYVISASPGNINPSFGYSGSITWNSTTISNTSYSLGNKINLISGTNGVSAISDVLSGSNLVANGSGGFNGTNIASIPKVNQPAFTLDGLGKNTSAVSLLYPITGYTKVAGDNGVDNGRYEIFLDTIHGNFRFNKLVLFATKLNADGTEDDTVLPVPFSVHSFEGTTIKTRSTSNGTGLGYRALIQLQFAINPDRNNLSSIHVSNWSDLGVSAQELSTDKKVTIFSGLEGITNIPAKLTVIGSSLSASTPVPTPAGTPQLALGYNNSIYSTLGTSQDGKLEISANTYIYLNSITYADYGIYSNGELLLKSGSDGIRFEDDDESIGGLKKIYGRPYFYLTSGGIDDDYNSFFNIEGIPSSDEVIIQTFNSNSLSLVSTKDIKLETNADTTHIIMKPDGNTTLDTYSQGGDTYFVVTAGSIGISSTTSNLTIHSYGKLKLESGYEGITFGDTNVLGGITSIYGRPYFYLTSGGQIGDYSSFFHIEGVPSSNYVAIKAVRANLDLNLESTKDIKLETNADTTHIIMKPDGSTTLDTYSQGGDTYFVVTAGSIGISSTTSNITINSYGELTLKAGSDGITFSDNSGSIGGLYKYNSRPYFYLTSGGSQDDEYFRIECAHQNDIVNIQTSFGVDININSPTVFNDTINFGTGGSISYEIIENWKIYGTGGWSNALSAVTNIPITDDILDIRVMMLQAPGYSEGRVFVCGTTSADTGLGSTEGGNIPGVATWTTTTSDGGNNRVLIVQPLQPDNFSTWSLGVNDFRAIIWYRRN
jgi:mannose-6-phosphate isomerase-like protein (cupin superfamily)